MLVLLHLVDPLEPNRTTAWWWVNELSCLIVLSGLHLQHCLPPIGISLGLRKHGWFFCADEDSSPPLSSQIAKPSVAKSLTRLSKVRKCTSSPLLKASTYLSMSLRGQVNSTNVAGGIPCAVVDACARSLVESVRTHLPWPDLAAQPAPP